MTSDNNKAEVQTSHNSNKRKIVRLVDDTQSRSEEHHHIVLLYRNQLEVNSVNRPIMTVMITNSAVKVLVYIMSSINLLDEETFKSIKKYAMLTKDHNPVIPYSGRPNIRGEFSAQLIVTQNCARSTGTCFMELAN